MFLQTRCEAEPAVAHHFSGDTLHDLRGVVGVEEGSVVGVRVYVDEAGGDDQPDCLDDITVSDVDRVRRLHGRYAAVPDNQVGGARGATSSVDDLCAADDKRLGCHMDPHSLGTRANSGYVVWRRYHGVPCITRPPMCGQGPLPTKPISTLPSASGRKVPSREPWWNTA